MPVLIPGWKELEAIEPPLEPGERMLVERLCQGLPEGWEIYVQPYVNDLHPDVVALHPSWGVIVYEVKDWNLSLYHYDHAGHLRVRTPDGEQPCADPVAQVLHYAYQIKERFLNAIEASQALNVNPDDDYLDLVRCALFNSCAQQVAMNSLFAHSHRDPLLLGVDSGLDALYPFNQWRSWSGSKLITPAHSRRIEEFRRWLRQPAHRHSSNRVEKLSAHQEELATPGTSNVRVRGVAGAGKSVVLARRAVRASREGEVLVTCYNITMGHELADQVRKAGEPYNRSKVVTGHFHGLVNGLGIDSGLVTTKNRMAADDVIDALSKGEGTPPRKYRGIYIDEGQDFEPRWIDLLARFLRPDGEMVFMADHRQGIYSQPSAADNRRLRLCNFPGDWRRLNKTYRLPWRLAFFLNDFAEAMPCGDELDQAISDYSERSDRELFRPEIMAWVNVRDIDAGLAKLPSIMSVLGEAHPQEVVMLVPDHALGRRLVETVERLEPRFAPVCHIFGPNPNDSESKRRKHAFWMGGGGLKMCTIHSFKGWEIENVVLLWSEPSGAEVELGARHALFYAAVSRSKHNLIVVNCDRAFDRLSDLGAWDHLETLESRINPTAPDLAELA